jgi:ATP-dependent RNA helicase RhlE
MSFKKFGFKPEILDAIKQCNYTQPTPIQELIIPHILKSRDVQAIAPTGTGKTGAFALPIIQNILKKEKTSGIKALILAPTKELAVQIHKNIVQYTINTDLKSVVIFGGAKMASQVTKLADDIDIVVATTGRLVEHIKQNTINLSNIEMLVLDEADTLLDMGFINEIDKVIETIGKKIQILLFSATLGESIKKLSDKILDKKVCVNIDKAQKATHKINQSVYYVSKNEKDELISYLIGKNYKDRFIVFTRTKEGAKQVFKSITNAGVKAISLHGDLTQGARLKAIEAFRNNKAQVLVATDITARGIDIKALECIINYDIPNSVDDYIHRIGRTGRAGEIGNAISLVSPSEIYSLKVIERKLQLKLKEKKEVGFGKDMVDEIKSPKIVIKKEEKRKTSGAFGKKKKEPSRKKLKGKRSGWNILDNR